MNISDIRTRIEAGADGQSFIAAKTDKLDLAAKTDEGSILTLVETAEPSGACDPLVQALVGKLPKPNTIWPIGDRASWLKTAAMAFHLVYKPGAGEESDLKIEEKPSGQKSAG